MEDFGVIRKGFSSVSSRSLVFQELLLKVDILPQNKLESTAADALSHRTAVYMGLNVTCVLLGFPAIWMLEKKKKIKEPSSYFIVGYEKQGPSKQRLEHYW